MKDLHAIWFKPPIEASFIGHQFSEIYKDNVYAPYLKGKKDLTILDVGANVGVTTYYFSQFAKQVYSVEPSVEHLICLKNMVETNNLDNVEVVDKAVYIKTGEYPLFHNKNKTMYSLHQAVQDSEKTETVETITLDDLFEKYEIEHVDLMKLDIEGSEVEVLSGKGFKKVADKIDTLIFEQHEWSGRNPEQVKEALRMRGFNVEQIESDASLWVARR